MSFITDIPLSDFFTGISLLLVIIGGLFAYHKWRRDIALKKADYINELTDKFVPIQLLETLSIFWTTENHGIQ